MIHRIDNKQKDELTGIFSNRSYYSSATRRTNRETFLKADVIYRNLRIESQILSLIMNTISNT